MAVVPHVTHVVVSLACGGLEKLVVQWTQERNRRHPGSTRICCLDALGPLAAEVDPEAVTCLGADRARSPCDVGALRRLRHQPCQVLHSHNLAAQQYVALARVGTAMRHVHTEHGSNPHVRGIKNRLRTWVLTRATHRIVAVSGSVARAMFVEHRVPRRRIVVVQNGIAAHAVSPEIDVHRLREQLALPADGPVIGSVGRLALVKGYDRLIRVFAGLAAADGLAAGAVRPVLLLVGDGPERERLAGQAREAGVADRVVFAGYQADVRPFYDVMDLFVLSSRTEGLSISLLEAMGAGVPVMVTDVGESRQVLADGEAGELLPDDPSDWGGRIRERLARVDADDTVARVNAARRRVTETYSIDAALDRYEAVYREACGQDVAPESVARFLS